MRLTAILLLVLCLTAPAWSRDPQRYAVVLSDDAPVLAARGDRAAIESARSRVTSAQELVKSQLRIRGITITGQARTLVNAVFILADPGDVTQLQALLGVKYIVPLQRVYRALD